MTATLRMTLAYFSVVPLQRLTSGIGALLILVALGIRVVSHDAELFRASAALLVLGGMLVVLVPLLMGGGMMRAASSRIMLHQRPWGRERMLVAATLTVTLLAATLTLMPTLALDAGGIQGARPRPFSAIPPLELFCIAWSIVAMLWLGIFIVTGNRLLSVLIGFVPLVLLKVGKPFFASMPDVSLLIPASAIMWTGFSLWYLRVPSIRRLINSRERQLELYDHAVNRFFRRVTGSADGISRARAVYQLLCGVSSHRSHLAFGVFMTLIAALVYLMFSSFFHSGHPAIAIMKFVAPLPLLPVLVIGWASSGFMMTRSARTLWLRAGLARMALFRHVERTGLVAGALSFGTLMVAVLVFSLMKWPAHTEVILVFFAVQVAFSACLFYGGLSLTRGWAATDVLLCGGLGAMCVFEIVMLRPWSTERSASAPLVFATIGVLVPVLRWHAARRWNTLDWRVAQLPRRMPGQAV